MIAKAALDRVGIESCAHRGAHTFRQSRYGASPIWHDVSEIGRLLRHDNHDMTGYR